MGKRDGGIRVEWATCCISAGNDAMRHDNILHKNPCVIVICARLVQICCILTLRTSPPLPYLWNFSWLGVGLDRSFNNDSFSTANYNTSYDMVRQNWSIVKVFMFLVYMYIHNILNDQLFGPGCNINK